MQNARESTFYPIKMLTPGHAYLLETLELTHFFSDHWIMEINSAAVYLVMEWCCKIGI